MSILLKPLVNVVQDTLGNVVVGATVTITNFLTSQPAQLYLDIYGAQPVTNPINVVHTDNLGRFIVYVKDGIYTVSVTTMLQQYVSDQVFIGYGNYAAAPSRYCADYFGVVADGTTLVSQKLQDWHDAILALGGGDVGPLPAGIIRASGIQHHPSVNFFGSGRNNTIIKPEDNVALKVDPNGRTNDVRAVFYGLARAQGVAATSAWMPCYSDFSISGNSGNQGTNQVFGIYAENGHNDPMYDTWAPSGDAKCYSAFTITNVEVYSCSGWGIDGEPQRQRAALVHSRSLNNGVMNSNGTIKVVGGGLSLQGNDGVIHPGCGFGGNTDCSVKFNNVSGAMVTQANIWAPDGRVRSTSVLGLIIQNCNGFAVTGNVIQDTIRCIGRSSNEDRGGNITGNDLRPDKGLFPASQANGVPLGTATDYQNAHIAIEGYDQVLIQGNDFSSSSNGKTFAHLITVSNLGAAHADIQVSSIVSSPGTQPWATLPVKVESGSTLSYTFGDGYLNYRRLGGASYMVAADETTNYDNTYGLVLGGYSSKPTLMDGETIFSKGASFLSGLQTMTEGGTTTIAAGTHWTRLSAGGTLSAVTLKLPANPRNGQSCLIRFGSAVTTLTLQGNGNTINSGDAITSATANTSVTYQYYNGTWYLR